MKGIVIRHQTFCNRTTTVSSYLAKIESYKILPEEELREYIKLYLETKDPVAREIVFKSCTKFVVSCAKNYQNPAINFMDLVNAGNQGVLDALDHVDLSITRCKFVSYAMYYIRLYIQNTVQTLFETIKMPVKVKRNMDNYEEGSPFRSIGKIAIQPSSVSLNSIIDFGDQTGTEMSEVFMNDGTFESVNKLNENFEIEYFMNSLNDKEKYVITNVFGLYGTPTKTLDEIAEDLNTTKSRVIGIRDKSISKMQKIAE